MHRFDGAPRLVSAYQEWRGFSAGAQQGDILSALVTGLSQARPGVLAHIFFGTLSEGGATALNFVGTDAGDALNIDHRHGPAANDQSLPALIRQSGVAAPVLFRRVSRGRELLVLVLPTGPDGAGAGFLGACQYRGPETGPVCADRPFCIEFLDEAGESGPISVPRAVNF